MSNFENSASQGEPNGSESANNALLKRLQDLSVRLARDAHRLSEALPKSEAQVSAAEEKIRLAQIQIQALADQAKGFENVWARSEDLAKKVGETVGRSSTLATERALVVLEQRLQTSANAMGIATEQMNRAMRASRLPWITAILLSFSFAILAAALTFKLTEPGARETEQRRFGALYERMYHEADPKEQAMLVKLAKRVQPPQR